MGGREGRRRWWGGWRGERQDGGTAIGSSKVLVGV